MWRAGRGGGGGTNVFQLLPVSASTASSRGDVTLFHGPTGGIAYGEEGDGIPASVTQAANNHRDGIDASPDANELEKAPAGVWSLAFRFVSAQSSSTAWRTFLL